MAEERDGNTPRDDDSLDNTIDQLESLLESRREPAAATPATGGPPAGRILPKLTRRVATARPAAPAPALPG